MEPREFWPNRVYVTADAKGDALTKRVLERLGSVEVIELAGRADPLTELEFAPENSSTEQLLSLGKRQLLLTRHLGGWLERCPGTQEHVCCNLLIVNPGEGCPLDCTYCYLQSYLKRNPTLKLFTNTGEMLDSIERKVTKEPHRLFRVGTGEVMDSLVWDELTDLTLELVPFFARLPNAMLELKSKFDTVENLLSLRNEHSGQTVVSWSVNAEQITDRDEAFTASLERRVRAAEKVVEAGYRVGFHFDPLVLFEGWEDGYRDAIEIIFSRVPLESVAWVSVSTLRYKPDMQKTMARRFPESALPFGEHFLAIDGKLRYHQPLRLKLERFVWNELKQRSADLPVYMCMESSAVWRELAGGPPLAGSELSEVFSRRGKLAVVQG